MNKDFFDTFQQRATEFSERGKTGESVRTEVVLATGRSYVVDAVVETTDSWVQIDGHDVADEDVPVSVVLYYHQIGHVLMTKQRPKMRHTGFGRS